MFAEHLPPRASLAMRRRGNGPSPESFHGGFGAGADVEFGVAVFEVLADGFEGDPELVGDFLVDESAGDEVQDLVLARGEVFGGPWRIPPAVKRLHHQAGDVAVHGGAAVLHLFDGFQDFCGGSPLEEVAVGAVLEGLENVFAVVVNGQHDDFEVGQPVLHAGYTFDAGHFRELDIHEHDIRRRVGGGW